jgi:hypothetical protein
MLSRVMREKKRMACLRKSPVGSRRAHIEFLTVAQTSSHGFSSGLYFGRKISVIPYWRRIASRAGNIALALCVEALSQMR